MAGSKCPGLQYESLGLTQCQWNQNWTTRSCKRSVDVIGDTETGLTGSEIGRCLSGCGIADTHPSITKRYRLSEALRAKQDTDHCANGVLAFTEYVMNPVSYVGDSATFETRRSALNGVLAFRGLMLGDDGRLRRKKKARTISEAESAASLLRKALVERRVHSEVLDFCRAELVVDDYFHAVFEATKSVAEKLRVKTGLSSDGSRLVDEALALGKLGFPRLAFNSLKTDSERNEHNGLVNLIKGIFGAFRNPKAHAPRIHWKITQQDALDILTTISLIHRRLDTAVRTHVP